jgi:perosamine synthetase
LASHHNLAKWDHRLTISCEQSVNAVLEALTETGLRVVFVIDKRGRLIGSVSDGDVRRGILAGYQLDSSVVSIMNPNFISFSNKVLEAEVGRHLSDRVNVIPILDSVGRPTSFVSRKTFKYIPAAEPSLNGNEMSYVVDCIESGWISSQGTYVRAFEEAFANYVGIPKGHALTVCNGTVALQLALAALRIGPGDEVIVPDLTFAATLNAVLHVGAEPVIVDVHPTNFTIAPEKIRDAISDRTKAIIPVHLYGQMCEMQDIQDIAHSKNLVVLEDAAEALGSKFAGKHAGTLGQAGAFSFFANKLITTGEGGMVVFKSKEVADRARILRDHGMDPSKRYWHLEAGYNFRMTNIQAAIGLAQIEKVQDLLSSKISLARAYSDRLGDLQHFLFLPEKIPHTIHSYWAYVVLFKNDFSADDISQIITIMLENNVEARPIFFPMHQMPAYAHLKRVGTCNASETASSRAIALPSSPSLNAEQIEDICFVFRSAVNRVSAEKLVAGQSRTIDA